MDHDERFNKLIEDLYISAKSYETLLDKKIIFECKEFVKQKNYEARFYEDNYLHLTGIKTKLNAKEFFKECLTKTISITDILNFPKEYHSKISGKLKNIQNIGLFFNQKLEMQESFIRNTIICAVASSDGFKTLGFVLAGKLLLPMTILNRNKLDPTKDIFNVKPRIIEIKKSPR